MIREPKYKAWNKRLEKMYEVYDLDFEFLVVRCRDNERHSTNTFGFIDIELLQYTGLNDKNGKMIFEGDLLLVRDTRICEVIFHADAGCWDLIPRNIISSVSIGSVSPASYQFHTELVGTIYENPELLNNA